MEMATTLDIIIMTVMATILVALLIWEVIDQYQDYQARKIERQNRRYNQFIKYRRRPLLEDKE